MSPSQPAVVAHCVHGLGLGGAQKVIAALVRGADRAAFRHVVYTCDDGVHRAEIESAGAPVRVIPRWIPKLDPFWVVRLSAAMRADAANLVHTHLFGDSLHGMLAARRCGRIPVIMTLHIGVEGLWGLQSRGYRWLLGRCARAVACSDAVAGSFADLARTSGCATVTIPNGIAAAPAEPLEPGRRDALRSALGAGPGEVLFAAVGRLAEQKGHRHLLAAMGRLAPPAEARIRLAIVGDGELRAALESQVAAAGLRGRVTFAGVRSDVAALLAAADGVVFASLFEGLPIALLEAMAAGRAVVATALPGILEAVRPDLEALIVPPGDAAALGAAMTRLAGDPILRERLGTAARRRFEAQFTAGRMVARYEAVYRDVLAARRSPSRAPRPG